MYLVLLKSAIVDALKTTFASNFLPSDFRGVNVSIEYPIDQQSYPSIWVNYDDQDTLTIVGIDHTEMVWDYPDPTDVSQPDPNHLGPNHQHEVTRWTFSGEVTLTLVALSSLERDNLYDQFVRVFAFSRMEEAPTDFRDIIESNDFIAMNINWDELRPHGDAAAPGTPWDTNEVIYEKSIGFDVEGEFISDPATNQVVPLSAIVVKVQKAMPDGTLSEVSQYEDNGQYL